MVLMCQSTVPQILGDVAGEIRNLLKVRIEAVNPAVVFDGHARDNQIGNGERQSPAQQRRGQLAHPDPEIERHLEIGQRQHGVLDGFPLLRGAASLEELRKDYPDQSDFVGIDQGVERLFFPGIG